MDDLHTRRQLFFCKDTRGRIWRIWRIWNDAGPGGQKRAENPSRDLKLTTNPGGL